MINNIFYDKDKLSFVLKAKSYLNEVKKVISIMENDLDSEDERMNIVGAISVSAFMQCLADYGERVDKLNAKFKRQNKEN